MTVQSTQLLHLAEETSDLAQDGGLSKDTTDNVWDAKFNRIKNLLDPTDPGDAVTLNYITKNQDSLLTQLRNTGAAQNSSIVSTGDSQNARLTSTGDTQNTRLNTTGDTQDKRLNDLGQKYVDLMTTLKDTATTKATEASNSAELSKKWAMSSSSPDGVSGNKSSKTWAEEAKTSATHAYTSETNAATSRDKADTYQTRAANSANVASQKASIAASSASNAATSASNAKTSETNAAASAKAAKQSAENAKTWDPTQYAKLDQVAILTEDAFSFDSHTEYADMNDPRLLYISSGVCIYDTTAKNIANLPRKNAFRLFNIKNIKSAATIGNHWFSSMQFLIYVNNAQMFWRYVKQDPGMTEPLFYKWAPFDAATLISQIPEATQAVHGYMSASDKKKLDGISSDTNANLQAEATKWREAYNKLKKRCCPTEFDDDELTILMDTALGSGNITLSQPYTNFDGLLIEYCDNNQNAFNMKYISTAELNHRIARAIEIKTESGATIALLSGEQYWRIWCGKSRGFTNTNFPVWAENAVIQRIYGVKFKNIE